MNKKLFLTFPAFVLVALLLTGCNRNESDPTKEEPTQEQPTDSTETPVPTDLEALKATVPVTENWVYSGKPAITISVENPNSVAVMAHFNVRFTTDMKAEVTTVTDSTEVPANGKKDYVITTPDNFAPGFYRATCFVNNKNARGFNFGIDPTQIVSAPDKQPDYDDFWAAAKEQLAGVDMSPELTELTAKSSAKCKVYMVEIKSIADGLTGDPVTVRGYYLEPQDGAKHPVIMHYFGYDDQNPTGKLFCPSANTGNYAEFYFGTRGQNINNRTASQREPDGKGDFVNIYGDWFAYHFGDKDSYYYRGAFMDCVQAVRFMATRETSDMTKVFAEGSSQGGAFTYAAAALSDYQFAAIAPCVSFLGDFPDYFKIVSWPAQTAKSNQGAMSDEEMYRFLSYFDTKNLATRISCPVIACSCLQDGTCPPHTHLAPYNNLLSTEKEIHFYPELQHNIPNDWPGKYMSYFKGKM